MSQRRTRDEYDLPSQTQSKVDKANFDKKVEEVVQYILFCALAEQKPIVRRADINKNVIKDLSRQFVNIINEVKVRLCKTFGFMLVDLDERMDKFGIYTKFEFDSNISNYKAANSVTRSLINDENDEFEKCLKYGVLMIALSLIFMNRNELDSQLFWEHLKRIDLHRSEKRHKYLGDVEKYFTVELVKEGYLEYEQVKGIDPPTFKFKWGPRAHLETTKKLVLDFVCDVYGGQDACKPKDWTEQYKDAMNDEKERGKLGVNEDN